MIDRRELIGAALGASMLAASAAPAQGWGDPPTPFDGDPEAPAWPPAESYRLWPKGPAGAPARLPARRPNRNVTFTDAQTQKRRVAAPPCGSRDPRGSGQSSSTTAAWVSMTFLPR